MSVVLIYHQILQTIINIISKENLLQVFVLGMKELSDRA